MQYQKINLIFDNTKSQIYDVNIGTPQESSISAILFSIYVKNMHDIINKNNVKSLNFIDDVIVYVVNKTIKQNCKKLNQTIHKLFVWTDENNVKFDDSKSELIYFEKTRNIFKNKITLSNKTVLIPQNYVKYMRIYLNKNLNFKSHVNNKIAAAKRNLHAILSLIKLERGLVSMAAKQLFLACICFISDYGSEIWYKNQKQFIKQFENLQNTAMKKILEVFKTSPYAVMKIEANLMPSNIKLMQKSQKYALKIAKLKNNEPLRKLIPNTFSQNWQNAENNNFSDNSKITN